MTDQIHLVVATPCFGGLVSSIYARSIFGLQRALRSKPNVDLKVHLRDGDALITRARANLVTLFLDDPAATHLLFVDADIGFTPEQVFRLIESGIDMVAGVYPIKHVNWDKAKRAMDAGRPNVPAASLDYVLEIDNPDHATVVNGFASVRYAGTGFLMIRRHVIERMCRHPGYASLQFFREHSHDALAGSANRFALFECMIDPATGTYLSEDFAFCKRWTDMGGEIWADLDSRLDHVGPSVFHGDVASQFAVAANAAVAGPAYPQSDGSLRMPRSGEPIAVTAPVCADRAGMAKLAKLAFVGADLRPMQQEFIAKLEAGTLEAGEGLDLSLIAQLLGDKQTGLAIQHEVLKSHQLFRLPCVTKNPRLRVLALAAGTDMGSNTPIEFLLEQSDAELMVLYVISEAELPAALPDHDVAIVIASDSDDCRDALSKIDEVAANWPRPLLNPPKFVGNLDRDKLHLLLNGIEGLEIPATVAIARGSLSLVAQGLETFDLLTPDLSFPLIVRPRGSHAGVGLAKIDDVAALAGYLREREEQEFFVSRFVDYSSADGQFRKYRIAFVDGQPFACHMAIADRWDIWYLNAGMLENAMKRLEEETFMRAFDVGFGRRHRSALSQVAARLGLDYFTIDCAETKDGSLLIFEADNTAVVHNMDLPDIFPYKPPQMRKIFDAFLAMLQHCAAQAGRQAA